MDLKSSLMLLSKYRGAIMGIAIIWVMIFHLPYRPNKFLIENIMSIGYGGVDIFLFLSGFGLYFSLSKDNTDLVHFYKKRFVRILPEFWLFLLVKYILTCDFNLHNFLNLIYRATTIGYWIPNTPYNLWYISCILFFYAIFPAYFYFLRKYGVKVSYAFVILGLICIAVYAYIMIFHFGNNNVGGLLILTISRIPIFFIGTIIAQLSQSNINIKISSKIVMITLILFISSILFLSYSLKFCKEYLWTGSLYFLPFIIITPILCLIISFIMDKIPVKLSSIFYMIGNISLELYIVHEFLYQKLFKRINDTLFLWGFGEEVYLSITIVILLSFVSAIILFYINRLVLQRIFRKVLKLNDI